MANRYTDLVLLAANYTAGIYWLSATSLALFLSETYSVDASPAQKDGRDAMIAKAIDELMSPITGLITPIATATVPTGALLCDGSYHAATAYPRLYAAISPTLKDPNGFYTPALVNRVPRGVVSANIGVTGGSDTHTLSVGELPSHHHTYWQPTTNIDVESVGVPDPTGVGLPLLPTQTSATGSNQAHNNLPAWTGLLYVIWT